MKKLHPHFYKIYQIAWLIIPFIFTYVLLIKSRFCIMFSCTGSNSMAMSNAIAAVIAAILLLKLIKVLVIRFYYRDHISAVTELLSFAGKKRLLILVVAILLVLLSYYLGKSNREGEYTISVDCGILCALS